MGSFIVNFDPILAEIMSETKYLEQLGFHVPEIARNVALQVRRGCILSVYRDVNECGGVTSHQKQKMYLILGQKL